MRLLIVSDLHYSLPQFDWVERHAGDFDGVIIAGDLLNVASELDPDVQVVVVLKYLKRIALKTRLIVSSGNHDIVDVDDEGNSAALWLRQAEEFGVTVDGQDVQIGTALISVCPWWEGDDAYQGMIRRLEEAGALALGEWFWVHHAPPLKTRVAWTGKRDAGDAEIAEAVKRLRPDIVFSGHVHFAPFRTGGGWWDRIGSTWLFNGGQMSGERPTLLILDTKDGTVSWDGVEDDGVVELGRM